METEKIYNRGLNFSISKYKILDRTLFIPHIRSNLEASIPSEILNEFNFNKDKDPVALVKIISKNYEIIRIKKLQRNGKSLTISLKKEKDLQDIKIKVLNIKNSEEVQKRPKISNNRIIKTNSIIPKFTFHCSLPCENSKKIAPIYLFKNNSNIIAGSYLSRKDIIFKDEFRLDELACSSIGLYEAEGGKTTGSFTNSQPKIINTILEFIEKVSNVNRKNLTASINCNNKSISKKRNLEEFWRNQTGIEKFQTKLHLSENVIVPQGILQVFFGSKIIKEFMCGMFNLIFQNQNIDQMAVLRGVLSGDGSPIQQTSSYITHHIATDKNHITFQEKFIGKICVGKISNIKNINNRKVVLYNNWITNLNFLFLDPYKFNILNRLKFAKQFLNLKTTKLFMNLKDKEIIRGIDIARNKLPIKPLIKSNLIRLNQISPKPNKRYEIYLTEEGIKKQKKLQDFTKSIYNSYINEIENFNNKLKKFDLT